MTGRSPSNQIGVGIIGASPSRGWGTSAHLPALKGMPEFKVVAVSARRLESARATAANFGVPHAFTDPFELASRPEVDLVAVTVRVPAHDQLVRAVLAAGKHVYCEWPLALNTPQAQGLLELATQKGVKHMVGLQARAAPAINYLRDLVADGYVGRVTGVNVLSASAGADRVAEANAYTLDASNGASLLTITSGHFLDAIGYSVSRPVEVSAQLSTHYLEAKALETDAVVRRTSPDSVIVSGRLANAASLSFNAYTGGSSFTTIRFQVSGSEGDLLVESVGGRGVQIAPLTLRGERHREKAGDPLPVLSIPERYRWVPDTVPDGPAFGVAQMYSRLGQAIRANGTVEPDFSTACVNHKLLDAIRIAADTGTRQRVDDV